ncbi:putative membrane protein [Alteripontixanthobacter maritimus]|uniref:Putative membrane protein n=1 Tax=Alteripontixanthobacter maritimus TaxID=2161824 RepID=A0A369Q6P6_9SPHN|nr:calcium/sodium antiporter [Alteripontixanthobacter maritimus]RDC60541.1 putative membrane protein [Alteripontixanthobacter maritimus]
MITAVLLALAGLVGLALGGELLVRGAVGIARLAGMSPLLTGLVVVGSATSMPEMVTSVEAALAGSPGIAWGNIVGSNIANSLLILGIAAIVAPIALTGAGRRDAVSGLLAAVLIFGIALSGIGSVWIGIALLVAICGYVYWRYNHPRPAIDEVEQSGPEPTWAKSGILFLLGLAALVAGGQALVTGAIELATIAGISETAIGLTVVAIGTSLPELAATLAAAWRGQSGLALGNVLGSNIYNLLLIGGVTMTIAPISIPFELVDLEMPVMVAASALLVLLCMFASRIGRWLGVLMVAAAIANSVVVLS